jgi:serine/threonine protein phosphatase PrpC
LRTAHLESIGGELQKSGSCAVAILIVGEIAYVANTGDSRAVMCVNGGKNFV